MLRPLAGPLTARPAARALGTPASATNARGLPGAWKRGILTAGVETLDHSRRSGRKTEIGKSRQSREGLKSRTPKPVFGLCLLHFIRSVQREVSRWSRHLVQREVPSLKEAGRTGDQLADRPPLRHRPGRNVTSHRRPVESGWRPTARAHATHRPSGSRSPRPGMAESGAFGTGLLGIPESKRPAP